MALNQLLRVSIVATVTLGAPAAYGDARDRAVVGAVLQHFAARSDASFYDPKGALLVVNETSKWVKGFTGLDALDEECPGTQPLYEALRNRNRGVHPVTEVLTPSKDWRSVKREEVTAMSPALPPPQSGGKRPPTKTLVNLHRPAYTESGDVALVVFHFVWSMHGAGARYILDRSGSKWRIRCSKLVFYV